MGRFNELLGAASQYSKGLAALFNVQEQEGVPTLAPELVATSDIFMRPEQWALHGGVLLWGRHKVNAGGAGNRSQSAIEPGADELVIVEKIVLGAAAAANDLLLSLSIIPLTTSTGNLVARDARMIVTGGGSGKSSTRIREQNNVPLSGTATGCCMLQTPANISIEIQLDMVLVAPWSLRLLAGADNVAIDTVTWFVRTRMATPRELSIGSL